MVHNSCLKKGQVSDLAQLRLGQIADWGEGQKFWFCLELVNFLECPGVKLDQRKSEKSKTQETSN